MSTGALSVPLERESGTDQRRVLLAAAFLRALATGMAGVLLGIYLAQTGLAPGIVGLVTGAGLEDGRADPAVLRHGGRRSRGAHGGLGGDQPIQSGSDDRRGNGCRAEGACVKRRGPTRA